MGGKEQSALYIIGYDGNSTYFYIDPHYVKDTIDMISIDDTSLAKEYFEKTIFKIEYSKLSNSICIPFFFQNKENF